MCKKMKRLFRMSMVLALLLTAAGVDAQKIDRRLTELVEQSAQRRAQGLQPVKTTKMAVDYNADGSVKTISALACLKKGAQCPTKRLEQMGIRVRFEVDNVAVLAVPADKLSLLEQVDEFTMVNPDMMARPMNDEARKETGVEKIVNAESATAAGLPQAYTGKGVVVGIIDQGIDFNHAAFRNSDGSSRVKRAVVYADKNGKKTEYTDATIQQATYDTAEGFHGTHTASTVTGSAVGNGYQGMAPEADIVLVGLAGYPSDGNIAEAIKYITDYAASVGKPVVVNISMGGVLGLHDGSDIDCKMIKKVTENGSKPGCAVVVSAGNSGSNWQSIVKKLRAADADADGWQIKTVLGISKKPTQHNASELPTYDSSVLLYAGDSQDFEADLKFVDITTGQFLSPVGHLFSDKKLSQPATFELKHHSVANASGQTVPVWSIILDAPVYLDSDKYRFVLRVKGTEGQTINAICDGDNGIEPCFDAPTSGGFNFLTAGYMKGHSDMTFNTMGCDDSVISVGAYITRTGWTDMDNHPQNYVPSAVTGKLQVIGEICDFSSYCVDDNGKNRPTLIAPGMGIISGMSSYDINNFEEGNIHEDATRFYIVGNVEKNGRNNWYANSQGTSMSSPVCAGTLALWMQANPQLTVNKIVEIMQQTCVKDAFCTDVTKIPSSNVIQAGLGKLDGLVGLKQILGTNGIETVSMDGHREATPSTMYSVDAPVYNMMGQRVDKSQRGLVIYKGRKYLNR